MLELRNGAEVIVEHGKGYWTRLEPDPNAPQNESDLIVSLRANNFNDRWEVTAEPISPNRLNISLNQVKEAVTINGPYNFFINNCVHAK